MPIAQSDLPSIPDQVGYITTSPLPPHNAIASPMTSLPHSPLCPQSHLRDSQAPSTQHPAPPWPDIRHARQDALSTALSAQLGALSTPSTPDTPPPILAHGQGRRMGARRARSGARVRGLGARPKPGARGCGAGCAGCAIRVRWISTDARKARVRGGGLDFGLGARSGARARPSAPCSMRSLGCARVRRSHTF